MIVSGNELYTTALKACVGAEIPRGLSEDLSRAALAIGRRGLDPVSMLVQTIELPDSEHLQWFFETPNWVCRNGGVVSVGPSLVDFSQLVVGSGYALAKGVKTPALIYGCVMAVAETSGLAFEVNFCDDGVVSESEWHLAGSEQALSSLPKKATDIAVRCLGPIQSKFDPQPIRGLYVNDEHWAHLKKLAEKILVPANESNSSDAGAGTTDND